MMVKKVRVESPNMKFKSIDCDFIMTNYKIIFKPYELDKSSPSKKSSAAYPNYLKEFLQIPLSYLMKIEKTVIDKKN